MTRSASAILGLAESLIQYFVTKIANQKIRGAFAWDHNDQRTTRTFLQQHASYGLSMPKRRSGFDATRQNSERLMLFSERYADDTKRIFNPNYDDDGML
jgi:hypothetical protein